MDRAMIERLLTAEYRRATGRTSSTGIAAGRASAAGRTWMWPQYVDMAMYLPDDT